MSMYKIKVSVIFKSQSMTEIVIAPNTEAAKQIIKNKYGNVQFTGYTTVGGA